MPVLLAELQDLLEGGVLVFAHHDECLYADMLIAIVAVKAALPPARTSFGLYCYVPVGDAEHLSQSLGRHRRFFNLHSVPSVLPKKLVCNP